MKSEAFSEALERLPPLIRECERLAALASQAGSRTVAARIGLARDSLADALAALNGNPEPEAGLQAESAPSANGEAV